MLILLDLIDLFRGLDKNIFIRKYKDINLEFTKKIISGENFEREDFNEITYFMRNTFGTFSLNKIIEMGVFNPLCNNNIFENLSGDKLKIFLKIYEKSYNLFG